jgi:hypothetical protein
MLITRSRQTQPVATTTAKVRARSKTPTPDPYLAHMTAQLGARVQLRGAARRPPVGSAAPDLVRMRERAKADIAEKLKLISQAYAEIDAATASIDEMSKVIEARLRSVNMTEYSDGVLRAGIDDVFSRQSTYMDPKKFRNAVESDAFWSSIKVVLAEASKHLSKTELARLSDVTPGAKIGSSFSVKPVQNSRKG